MGLSWETWGINNLQDQDGEDTGSAVAEEGNHTRIVSTGISFAEPSG